MCWYMQMYMHVFQYTVTSCVLHHCINLYVYMYVPVLTVTVIEGVVCKEAYMTVD